MLLSLLFPIADTRLFNEAPDSRLVRPMWPTPDADSEFVRSFGRIRRQPGRWIKDWVGESAVCDARAALRFTELDKARVIYPWGAIGYEGAYRSLFADGQALCKFEVACIIVPKFEERTRDKDRSNYADSKIISEFLDLKVRVSIPQEEQKLEPLFSSKISLARAYRIATSCNSTASLGSDNNWLVRPCAPALLLEYARPSARNTQSIIDFRMPHGAKRYPVPNTDGIVINHFFHEHKRQHISVWCISTPENRTSKQLNIARKIKLYLLRLHAEKSIYNHIITCIATNKIDPPAFSEAAQSLQAYLNESTRKIRRYENRSEEMLDGFWGHKTKLAEEAVLPNERALLFQRLESIGVRNNIVRKVVQLEGRSSPRTVTDRAMPTRIYIDFAPTEAMDATELIKRLHLFERRGSIVTFSEHHISPGEDVQKVVASKLLHIDIFIILVSVDYLISEVCQQRLQFCRSRRIPVVPILIRSTNLDYSAIDGLALLPPGAVPLRSRQDQDHAWTGVVEGILRTAGIPPSHKGLSSPSDTPASQTHKNQDASSKKASPASKIDIAIITIMNDEFEAVRHFLMQEGKLTRVPGRRGKINLYSWIIGQVQSALYQEPFSTVLAMTGRQENMASMDAVRETIERFRPQYTLLVGTAGGLSRDGVRRGTVVISSSIHGYQVGTLDKIALHPRLDVTMQADLPLLNAAMSLPCEHPEWYRDLHIIAPGHGASEQPNVVAGPIASGDKVMECFNDPTLKKIMKFSHKLVAVEMADIGATAAIQHNREKQTNHCGFLMIRGISDMVLQKNSTSSERRVQHQDLWKKYASAVAACFSIKLIKYAWPVPPR